MFIKHRIGENAIESYVCKPFKNIAAKTRILLEKYSKKAKKEKIPCFFPKEALNLPCNRNGEKWKRQDLIRHRFTC